MITTIMIVMCWTSGWEQLSTNNSLTYRVAATKIPFGVHHWHVILTDVLRHKRSIEHQSITAGEITQVIQYFH